MVIGGIMARGMKVFTGENAPLSVGVLSTLYRTPPQKVKGIGTGAAYAAGDAFGLTNEVTVPVKGTIAYITFMDFDGEAIQKDIFFFNAPIDPTTDNDPYGPSDADLRKWVGVASVFVYYAAANNQVGIAYPALAYVAPRGILYYQLVTRGADNIAATYEPEISFVVV